MSGAVLRLVSARVPDTASLPEQLRQIAFDVESGLLTGASQAVVVIDGPDDSLMVYGISPGDSESRLNAAHMLLALAQRELQRIAEDIRKRE